MQINFVFWNIHKRPEAFEHLVRLTIFPCFSDLICLSQGVPLMRKTFDLPDYGRIIPNRTPPVEILRAAAEALTEKTGGRVEGSVFTGGLGGVGSYRHTFYLRAPSLDDFTDPLFYVWHETALYPANILTAGYNQRHAKSCDNDSELHDEVQRILSSEIARQRIGAMLAQVGERS